MIIVTADILEFIIVILPTILLAHLAFKIAFVLGRSKGGSLLLTGTSIIIFSLLFKMYFDFVFGGVDTFWYFILTFGTAVGIVFAFAGTSGVYSFLISTRSGEGRITTDAARIAGIIAIAFTVIFASCFITLAQPIYWRLGALCYVVGQVALFGIGIFIGEFFHLVGKPSASGKMRYARILTSYYLVGPILWWACMRFFQNTDSYPLARLLINLPGAVVSFFFAAAIMQYVHRYLPMNLRQAKTTYLDILRIKVLRDFYIIGICMIGFVSIVLLTAESLYENLRLSTIESHAESRLSMSKLAAARIQSSLEDVMLTLQRSESSADTSFVLESLGKNDGYVDAVGGAGKKMNVAFFHSNKILVPDSEITSMLKSSKEFEEKGTKVSLYYGAQTLEFFVLIRRNGKLDTDPYSFAFVNVPKIMSSSMIGLDGLSLRLISPDMKIAYSNNEDEIGENFQDAILADHKVAAKSLGENLRSLSGSQFKGYDILKGHDPAGVGEYFILVAAPVDFRGYKGTLATVEPEESVSGLFRPTNSLLILSGFLAVGLFCGGIIVMSVAFRWSMRLEKEVQNKIFELRSSEDKYRRIVENPYIGSFIMVDGRAIFSNARLAEILETDVERLSGSDLSVFVEGGDYISLKDVFDSIIQGEKFGDKWQVAGITASGRNIKLSGYSSIINIGNKRGVQSLVVDSTMEFREKEKLEQFERLESMATLAAGIAHDFNNILQVVLGSSQLLQRRLQDGELIKYADNITNVAIRGSDLSRRLLTFSRQKGLEERRRFDINEIILESLPLFEETFPRTIKIETELNKEPIFIDGDQSQIQQVIFNLAVNARDAMPHGGTLTLKTEMRDVNVTEADVYQATAGTFAYIMVKDNGGGIPPELMSKVFEPFFTTKPSGKGTGLGLSVVYGIVRSHNGFLKLYSEVKKGTAFSIYLPLAEFSEKIIADTAPDEVKEEAPTYGSKILFVDDEVGIREAAQFLLEQIGYEVITAKDGISAIEIYKKEWRKISLVVLDLNMPELSGREVLENFTIINPDVRVLIATGYITKDERTGLKGIVEVIEKPFDFDQLAEKVRSALASSRNSR